MTPPATPAAEARDLHAQIMNLPCPSILPPEFASFEYSERWLMEKAYKIGHRDARHAAAELVCSASPPASPSTLRQAMEALWVCAEHNALHFGENHNTVIQSRAALSAIKAELAAPSLPLTSDKVQMPDKARQGIEALHYAVDQLLTTGRYVDEEGEATSAIADLLSCIADPPFRLAASPAMTPAAADVPKMVMLTEGEINVAIYKAAATPMEAHSAQVIQRAFAAKNGMEIERLDRAVGVALDRGGRDAA